MPSPLSTATPARPRRTTKTPTRRAAAPPPSTAPPRVGGASKVIKKRVRTAAERRSDTAVTAGLVGGGRRGGRTARAPEPAAGVQNVATEPEQQHAPKQVAAAPVVPVAFRYSAQWIMRHPKDGQLQADSEHQMSDATDEAIAKANAFIDRGVSEYPHYTLLRKHLSAGYTGLAERHWVPSSFTPEAYERLVEHMQEWHADGKRFLTLKVTVTMRDVTMEDVTGEPIVVAAAAAPSSSRVRNAATPRVRNTATNRQLAALPDEQQALEVAGNWSSSITAKWSCTQRACSGYRKGLCYWTIADEATYHVPVIAPVLTAWAEGIRDGVLTSAEPTTAMYGLMMTAKYEKQIAQSGRGLKGSGVVVNVNQPPSPSLAPTPAPAPHLVSSQSTGGKAYSSPVRLPSDPPELSDLDQLDAFFLWCKRSLNWRGLGARLDEILVLVKANGDNVHTMANISKEDWLKDINVADGYRKRLKMSAKVWINSGMPVVGSSPPAG